MIRYATGNTGNNDLKEICSNIQYLFNNEEKIIKGTSRLISLLPLLTDLKIKKLEQY